MQTTIKRKIKPSQMIKVFDSGEVNIRWYEVLNENATILGRDDKTYYSIIVRHNEDENPKELFNEALSTI